MSIGDRLSFSDKGIRMYKDKIGSLIDFEKSNEDSFIAYFRDLLANYFSEAKYEVIVASKIEEGKDKPDITVYTNKIMKIKIMHIEAKLPGTDITHLLTKETKEKNRLFNQIFRYRGGENNNFPVLVTDFLNVWIIDKNSLNSDDSDHKIKYQFKVLEKKGKTWKVVQGAKQNLEKSLNYLCEDIELSINRVSQMIPHLVVYARKLREKIQGVFTDSTKKDKVDIKIKEYLSGIRSDFLQSLFSEDKQRKFEEFADLISQTIVYGAFTAWLSYSKSGENVKEFRLDSAFNYLSYDSFLYAMFTNQAWISPEIRKEIIKPMERVFQSSEFGAEIEDIETLMITFYSDFLELYDRNTAKDRGIVYTPYPVVDFMNRGLDHFLKLHFRKEEGILSPDITYLDPAAGTMAFACDLIRKGWAKISEKYGHQEGRIKQEFISWLDENFLKNFFAFEILMAPYVLGHLRVERTWSDLIENKKKKPGSDSVPLIKKEHFNKLNLFLFNTLMGKQLSLKDFSNKMIGKEIIEALRVREKENILVILGNPPYKKSSQNKFKWIEEKVEVYRENTQIEGMLKLRNFSALLDDYVKFIRFAQWKITQAGSGIIAFITNNYYLDGLIFRGMRYSLASDFSEIWIVDLHGAVRKEIPSIHRKKGITKDENVFYDKTKSGVSIVFLIRLKDHDSTKGCEINYTDIWGLREKKFEFLENNNLNSLDFTSFKVDVENENKKDIFRFAPYSFPMRIEYEKYPVLIDIFETSAAGIITGHDRELVSYTVEECEKVLEDFFIRYSDLTKEYSKTKGWKPSEIQYTTIEAAKKRIVEWNWRGFDRRYIPYDKSLLAEPCYKLLQYMIQPESKKNNLCLIINGRSRGCDGSSSVFVTDTIFEFACLESARGLHCYAFLLYVGDTPEGNNGDVKQLKSNIKSGFIDKLSLAYKKEINARQIFYYIYGILYTPRYRMLFQPGLKEGFPRIPFTKNYESFLEIAQIGGQLIEFHCMKRRGEGVKKYPMSASSDYRVYDVSRNDFFTSKGQRKRNITSYDPDTERIYFKKKTKKQKQIESAAHSESGLKDITWIGNISQEMWDFEIGGFQQLKTWLYNRRYRPVSLLPAKGKKRKLKQMSRPLNSKELDYFLDMCYAIETTIELMKKLDVLYKREEGNFS